jgi:aryl-alcohol dehydrogenase-like predicted oxidoreductase
MEYTGLGDLTVSSISLGTWMFGGQTDEATAARIVGIARDAGVNFIDTADVYADGESEYILGRHIARTREHWVLATKVGSGTGVPPGQRRLEGRQLMPAIEASLRRLRTDHVDIYYLHEPDPETPLAETLEAMGEVLRQGKARHFGFSNYRGWQIADMVHLCDNLGVPRPIVCQPYYNALNRIAETEIFPACAHLGIGVSAFSPLAGGLLSGKYRLGEGFAGATRAGRGDTKFSGSEFREELVDRALRVKAHAVARGMTAAQFATAWVLASRHVTSAIAGPRTEDQWRESLAALEYRLDAEDEAFVSNLVPPGQPSTPGYADPWTRLPERPTWPSDG